MSIRQSRVLRFEQLEARRVPSALLMIDPSTVIPPDPVRTCQFPVQEGAHPLTAVPALNSLPGAKAWLFLDFDGDFQSQWGYFRNITTPPYDQDGDPTTFSDAELEAIDRIWRIVAEDYAPFRINVTTVPVPLADGKAVKVDIGGDWRDWLQQPAGGVAWLDGFRGPEPNVAYVFSANPTAALWPRIVAENAAHEAGHLFDLKHQSTYDAQGVKLDEYSAGDETWYATAPIMGRAHWATRGIWWYGQTDSMFHWQDDFAVLASVLGLRADDHGGTATSATKLSPRTGEFSVGGRIGKPNDSDWFRLDLKRASLVTVQVVTPSMPGSFLDPRLDVVGDLDPVLEIRNRTGKKLLARDAPAAAGIEETNLGASITLVLPAGSYRLVVAGDRSMGNVGSYVVSGAVGSVPAMPENLRAVLASTFVVLFSMETPAVVEPVPVPGDRIGRVWIGGRHG